MVKGSFKGIYTWLRVPSEGSIWFRVEGGFRVLGFRA